MKRPDEDVPRRLDYDLARRHELDRLLATGPEGAEVAVAVQVFDDRQQAVDLVLCEVAEVLDAHQTERLRRQADLEQRRSGEVEQRDPTLPPGVQELGPGDLLGCQRDDVAVVRERPRTVLSRHARAEPGLVADGLPGCLVEPLDEEPVELREGVG